MLQVEISAIFSTCIELPHGFKTFVLSNFERLLKTGFTLTIILQSKKFHFQDRCLVMVFYLYFRVFKYMWQCLDMTLRHNDESQCGNLIINSIIAIALGSGYPMSNYFTNCSGLCFTLCYANTSFHPCNLIGAFIHLSLLSLPEP